MILAKGVKVNASSLLKLLALKISIVFVIIQVALQPLFEKPYLPLEKNKANGRAINLKANT